MTEQLRELGARLRNLFVAGEFQKRYDDGKIQVKTHNGRVLEKKEAFPYGFCARAKGGRVFVFCQGGNMDGFEIMPVQPGEDVTPPKLDEGDAALYTGGGGWIVVRDSGGIEVNAGGGKVYMGNDSKNICALLIGLIDEVKAIVTSGSPVSQKINPATQQKLEAYKNQVKALFMESA